MAPKEWRQRMLATTRGRVLSLLRWGPRTVSELAASVDLTDNAVRLHLAALERDGLVEQEGVRRGASKPAHVYQLTREAENIFPKAYATVLSEVLALVREQRGTDGLEAFLRSVGQRAGERARAGNLTLRDRVDAAVAVLGELGGLADVVEQDDAFMIRGFSCPLAAIVGEHPEACTLAEELVSGVTGTKVVECCDRRLLRCSFRVEDAEEKRHVTAAHKSGT
jgi:predicted ArsR family transcriptional regulator